MVGLYTVIVGQEYDGSTTTVVVAGLHTVALSDFALLQSGSIPLEQEGTATVVVTSASSVFVVVTGEPEIHVGRSSFSVSDGVNVGHIVIVVGVHDVFCVTDIFPLLSPFFLQLLLQLGQTVSVGIMVVGLSGADVAVVTLQK